MASRKPNSDDLAYIERKLSILKDQMDNAENYLSSHNWTEIEDESKREKEFRFQRDIADSLLNWTETYTDVCGILDVYKKLEENKKKHNLKSGMEVSGIQRFVKRAAEEKGDIKRG